MIKQLQKECAMDHDHARVVEELLEALLLVRNKAELMRFLKDLCTPSEIIALAERWQVCKLLEKGTLSYREINAATGASLATITRVARFLKTEPHQGYKLVLERMKKKNKK